MSKIKAINTGYNGYLFRSRLEARWAVFFDEMEIKYEYELEGFEFENGVRYLPDFYLPEMDLYVEIKPSFGIVEEKDVEKFDAFALTGNKNLLLIIGSPNQQNMFLINRYSISPLWEIKENSSNEDIVDEYKGYLNDFECEVEFSINPFNYKWTLATPHLRAGFYDCKYEAALKKAKQARFEFKD